MTRPLLVRLPNHLGDTLMTLPALTRLRDAGLELTLIGPAWARPLFEATGWPVVALPREPRAQRELLRATGAARGTREILLLTNSFSSALRARWAGLNPIGYARDARSLLLKRAVPVPKRWAADMHTVEYYDALAAALLKQPLREVPPLALPLALRAHAAADRLLVQAGVRGPYVALCPGATGRHRGRDKAWPEFGRLAGWLVQHGHTAVALPGPGERARFEAILPHAQILPDADVAVFAAVLARARAVVANDSGPSHLAAAVGANLLVLFGVTEPERTRPWHPKARSLGSQHGWPAFEQVTAMVNGMVRNEGV
jgi:heptosyltransferase-2